MKGSKVIYKLPLLLFFMIGLIAFFTSSAYAIKLKPGDKPHWFSAKECKGLGFPSDDQYEPKRNTDGDDDYSVCCVKVSWLGNVDSYRVENGKVWGNGICQYWTDTGAETGYPLEEPNCPQGTCLVNKGDRSRGQLGVFCVPYGKVGESNDVCSPLSVSKEACASGQNSGCFVPEAELVECDDCPSSGPSGDLESNPPVECTTSSGEEGIFTAIGCIPVSPTGITNWLVKLAVGLSGFLVVFRFVQGGIMMMTATGNPDKIQEAKEIMTSAIIGVLVIIGAVALLQFLGVQIFQLPGFEEIQFGGS